MIKHALLHVHTANTEALDWYQHRGFKVRPQQAVQLLWQDAIQTIQRFKIHTVASVGTQEQLAPNPPCKRPDRCWLVCSAGHAAAGGSCCQGLLQENRAEGCSSFGEAAQHQHT